MRLSEDRIKEAILHPDLEIRERALRYFEKSYRPDPSIMPTVIKAVETYGRKDAYLIGSSRDLAQTEETIAWVIDELNDERCNQYENYAYNLSMVLMEADPALLAPRESSIYEARYFLAPLMDALEERLQMTSWDPATCWQKLEELCEEGKDKQYVNEINMGRAKHIVEALARHGAACEEKVHSLLTQNIDDYRHNPMKWLEPLAIRLAGQAHLESTIPLIVAKLHEDADLLSEECAEALGRIGTPEVLETVAEAFPTAEDYFRLYAAGMLEHIHSDRTVEICLDLLPREEDENTCVFLAYSLLSQFAFEGIELVRQLLKSRSLGYEERGLRNDLVETATIMGVRFPEFEEWRAAEIAEKEEHRRMMERLEGNPRAQLIYGLSKLTGQPMPDLPQLRPTAPPAPRPAAPAPAPRPAPFRKPVGRSTVGRNAPCPCGSGKKFKNCCMRK